jgi:glycosyltransferase involved in cell wall biosynthesis
VTEQRVAIYVPSLHAGGAERMMVTLANAFAARGLTVDLVLANAQGPYLQDVSHAVRVVDLRSNRVLASLPGLVRYLRCERLQAMLSALNYANVIAIMARSLARVHLRLVVSERSTLSLSKPLLFRGRLMTWLMHWLYPRADKVLCVSQGVADDLAKAIGLSPEKISVVYNPVVSDELIEKSHAALDHAWFKPGEPPVILGVGRLTVEKDFASLLRAIAKVRTRRPVRLVILGEGDLRTTLEKLAQELGIASDVLMPGFVENPFPWMRNAALFVLSSRWEGLPGVLIEAMACGTPVVSTDCPSGPAEILENGRWGRLVPVGDADALAQAVEATLDDSPQAEVTVRANDFNTNRATEAYLSLLGVIK